MTTGLADPATTGVADSKFETKWLLADVADDADDDAADDIVVAVDGDDDDSTRPWAGDALNLEKGGWI